ncbi:MAG: hypothetical protein O3C05_03300, partial [Proteobacteria bacterium]|nr:hypothetical protein [Pseudomonadota bacterium]
KCIDFRLHARSKLKDEILKFNSIISRILSINNQITENVHSKKILLSSQKELIKGVKEISEYIGIRHEFDNLGRINITTRSGNALVEGSHAQFLSYAEDINKDVLGLPSYSIEFQKYSARGAFQNPIILYSSDGSEASDLSSYEMISGKFGGILKEEGMNLPNLQRKIDSLAVNIAEQVNKFHRKSSPLDGFKSLKGNKVITLDSEIEGNGMLRLGLLDQGVNKSITGHEKIDIDLKDLSLKDDKTNTQAILDYINDYFAGSGKKRLEIENLADLRLFSKNKAIAPGEKMKMGIEIGRKFQTNNEKDYKIEFKNLEIKAFDGAGMIDISSSATLSGSQYFVNSNKGHQQVADGIEIECDVPTSGAGYPYDISFDIIIPNTDMTTTRTIRVSYEIQDPAGDTSINKMMLRRFSVSSAVDISSSSTSPIALPNSKFANNALSMYLVDQDGSTLSSASQDGYLQIQSKQNFVIDESTESVAPLLREVEIGTSSEKVGFNDFFKLNEILVFNNTNKNQDNKNDYASKSIQISSDIEKNIKNLSIYAPNIFNKLVLRKSSFSDFVKKTNIMGEGINILVSKSQSEVFLRYQNSQEKSDASMIFFQKFDEKMDAEVQVDVDEELRNISNISQNHEALSQVYRINNKILEKLIEITL